MDFIPNLLSMLVLAGLGIYFLFGVWGMVAISIGFSGRVGECWLPVIIFTALGTLCFWAAIEVAPFSIRVTP